MTAVKTKRNTKFVPWYEGANQEFARRGLEPPPTAPRVTLTTWERAQRLGRPTL